MKKLILLITVWLAISHSLQAQTSSFTYQGHLMDGGSSANGNYDILFTLKNALDSGSTVGTPQAIAPVSAVNGIFTVTLDFGGTPFDGSDRWVELAVRPAGSSDPYTVLSPRQKITATPYSVRALNATNLTGAISGANIPSGTITGSMLTGGTISGAQLASGLTLGGTTTGTFSGDLTGNVSGSAASFTGNLAGDVTGTQGATVIASVGGSSAANVNAAVLLANAATSANTAGTLVKRDASGNFSAGTLNVTGGINLSATTGVGTGMITQTGSRLMHTFGPDNFFAGLNAGNLTMTGARNTAIGDDALLSNTTGWENTATGRGVLQNNTTGLANTGHGNGALRSNTTGNYNTALGWLVLRDNDAGFYNVGVGANALDTNINGDHNTGVGRYSLTSNTVGDNNTATGSSSLEGNTTGIRNTAVGSLALDSNTTGSNNIALGFQAGHLLTTGSNNIAVGHTGVAGESGKIRLGTSGTHSDTYLAGVVHGDGSGLTNLSVAADSITGTISGAQITIGVVGSAHLASGLTLAGTTTGTFSGPLTGNVIGNVSGSAASFTGVLAGDVSGTQSATVVNLVGGVTAANVASSVNSVNAATDTNTASALVKRDANGDFTASTITATLNGNATSANTAVSFTGLLGGDVAGPQGATTIASTTVTGKVLAGFAPAAGTISATDTILGAIGKLDGNVALRAPLASPTFTGTVSAATVNLDGALTLAAGTETLAPLKLQSGVNLTSPVFGAVEFDGTNVFVTNNSTTPTRKTLAYTDSVLSPSQISAGTISSTMLASSLTLAGTTTGTFSGNLTGNVTGNVSGSASSFTGSLAGDVTGTQGATVVASVGGSSAANVNAATLLANAATSSNTNGTIVRRDANGSFHAGTITLSSSLRLPAITSDGAGVIMRNGLLFIHGIGTDTFFAGPNAGNLTMTGGSNTAVGASAMFSNTSGANNVAVGHVALGSNTTGTGMVAVGATALMGNTTGAFNTGIGQSSLLSNTTGTSNTACGYSTLYSNTVGRSNTSIGNWSMFNNTNASQNVAIGESALTSQSYGGAGFWNSRNVAVGYRALFANQPVSLVTGANNTAIGTNALQANSTGANNIALGSNAGSLLTTGNDNIAIGHVGVAGESGVIRLGTTGTHTKTFAAGIRGITTGLNDAVSVVIDSNGQLGTISSSRRYKDDIADMGDTSARLQALRPVTFRYKQPFADGARPVQFGLIAEEVAEVFPELAVFNDEGQPETVKYQDLTPLLLNEVQKLRTENDELARQLAEREAKDKERDERIARLESLLSPAGSTAQTKGN